MNDLIKDTFFKKEIEAQKLFEVDGMQQKEIAKKVGVSEKTLGKWVIKYKWLKNDTLVQRKNKAKQLVLKHGLSQKEAAAAVGVSEKSVSKWAIAGKWKALKSSKEQVQPGAFIKGFKEYLFRNYPKRAIGIGKLVDEYADTL